MLTETERQVIALVQDDIPLDPRPYRILADTIGITEDCFIDTLNRLLQTAVIRRYGATLRHQKSGFAANAMIAWQVEEERIETVGGQMSEFTAVSHCYRRNPGKNWPFNLYTMVHGKNEKAVKKTVSQMAAQTQVSRYRLLFSRRELKKTSMRYILPGMDAAAR